MNIDFQNKIVVITGAASGIGMATAQMMIASNAHVVLIDINREGGKHRGIFRRKKHFLFIAMYQKRFSRNCI